MAGYGCGYRLGGEISHNDVLRDTGQVYTPPILCSNYSRDKRKHISNCDESGAIAVVLCQLGAQRIIWHKKNRHHDTQTDGEKCHPDKKRDVG